MKTVSAKNLMCTISSNVNNPLLTDGQFREFVRNSAGICQEVLEWREHMAQLGKHFSEHQMCPEVVPEKVQLSSAYGNFSDDLTKCVEEVDSKTKRGKVSAVVSDEFKHDGSNRLTPLTPEMKEQFKGTIYEKCETIEECQARHFQWMT